MFVAEVPAAVRWQVAAECAHVANLRPADVACGRREAGNSFFSSALAAMSASLAIAPIVTVSPTLILSAPVRSRKLTTLSG